MSSLDFDDDDELAALGARTGEWFSFPPGTRPYDIQLELMRALYKAAETRHIAILESPTGTV